MANNVTYRALGSQSAGLSDGTTFKTTETSEVHVQHVNVDTDFPLWVARGLVSGITSVNKFGKAPSGMQITATDVWSRADAAATQQIWLAPTAARVHTIASTSASDDGLVVRVYGLPTWGTAETTQDITLPDGTTTSLVIVHRMKILSVAAHTSNVGTITATAAAPDSTITAVILPLEGQTEMAIYGVPSTQSFYLTRWSCSMGKEVTAQSATISLKVNEAPNLQTTGYIYKNDILLLSTGVSASNLQFHNPIKFAGPCIIKAQGIASTADVDVKAAFDGYLVTN